MVSHTPASRVCYPLGPVGIGFVAFGVNSGGDGAGGGQRWRDGTRAGVTLWQESRDRVTVKAQLRE